MMEVVELKENILSFVGHRLVLTGLLIEVFYLVK